MLSKGEDSEGTDCDVPFTRNPRIKKIIYAKAIYDNVADTPDELEFKTGDLLVVIEPNTDGCEGWWLCKLDGRQGLCPGNRLRLISSYDSGCFSPSPASSLCSSLVASSATLNSSMYSADIYENSSIVGGSGYIKRESNINSFIDVSQGEFNCHLNQNILSYNWQQSAQQQKKDKRRSWHISPNKVLTPERYGDVYGYNCPTTNETHSSQLYYSQPKHHMQQQAYSNQSIYQNVTKMSSANGPNEFEMYDIPKPATSVNYDCPKNLVARTSTITAAPLRSDTTQTLKNYTAAVSDESYDIPRPLSSILHQQNLMTPSSSNSSLLTCDCSFSSSSNRSSLANLPDYDVPRRNPLPVRVLQQSAPTSAILSNQPEPANEQHTQNQPVFVNGNTGSYSFPLVSTQSSPVHPGLALVSTVATKELPLELSSALDTLAKLQTETTLAITRLLSFVMPNWREREKLEAIVMEVKLSAVRLRTALHDLTEFSEGALGNAARSDDRTLGQKLRFLVKALRDADKLIHELSDALDAQGGWTVDNLSRCEDKSTSKPPDSLDQLVACAQTLIEDVRQTTSFIQGNALLLFKRNAPLTTEDASNGSGTDLVENYDYVCFESKDSAGKKNSDLREAIPQNLQQKFDSVIKTAETTAMLSPRDMSLLPQNDLTNKDKLLLKYYTMQITTHMGNLRQAIDSFLETVEKNQPPKFFIAYGKFVVVSAHNLVNIGDIVHRNVSKSELKKKILCCTDALSEALKSCVVKSKKAAAHFPSVTAVQEMVDSVVDISHLSFDLKTAMLQAVQLSF